MRCPACQHTVLEHEQGCAGCGFSLDALSAVMGIPPTLGTPLADLAGALSGGARKAVLRAAGLLHQRFPQLSFAAVLMDVPAEVPLAVEAFWLFNKGSLFSAVERAGDNHGVLLLVDVPRDRAVAMIGYGLEPFVSEVVLEVCLTAAGGSLRRGLHGAAIEVFVRELERQLSDLVRELPRAFGYAEGGLWKETAAGAEVLPLPLVDEDLY